MTILSLKRSGFVTLIILLAAQLLIAQEIAGNFDVGADAGDSIHA